MIWEQSDSIKLREYIQKSGDRLRGYLRNRIPACDGKTIEEVAMTAKFKEGYEKALKEIDDMINNQEISNDPSAGTFTTM
jgi:hypothetical protein